MQVLPHEALQRCVPQLWALFDEALPRAGRLPPQELSNLILAMATSTLFHPRALAGACSVCPGLGHGNRHAVSKPTGAAT